MALPKRILANLHNALNGTPAVMGAMVASLPADSGFWDYRPAPERFTPREVFAHVADWDLIFAERIARTVSEDHPTIIPFDEEQMAIDHGYATQDAPAALQRFCESRADFVARIRCFTETDWSKTAHREDMGEVSVEAQVVLVTVHDGYHTKQIAEFLESWRQI